MILAYIFFNFLTNVLYHITQKIAIGFVKNIEFFDKKMSLLNKIH